MADNVSIIFSAQIGQLVSEVGKIKEEIASIAAPVNAVASAFTGFGEAFAGAFAIGQVGDFVSQMEDIGTKTTRTAAMLGVSTTQVQELGFIAKATGGDTEGLALSMERLQVNLQKAQSGTGPAAQALQALGLSAKSLIGLSLDQQMDRIADAVSKFADGGNKTAIVMSLLGRNGAQMIPVLDKGRAGLDELRQSAEDAGAIVSKDTVEALDHAGTAAVTLRTSITALGEAIVARFSKPLIEAAGSLTTFTSDLSALVQTGHLAEAAMTTLGTSLRMLGANLASTGRVLYDFASLNGNLWLQIPHDWQAGIEEMKRIQKEGDAQLVTMATQAKAELQKILAAPDVSNKPPPPAMAVPNTDALKAMNEMYAGMVKKADDTYQLTANRLSSEFKLHEITYSQETQELYSALEARNSAEQAAYAAELSNLKEGSAQYQKVLNERKAAYDKYILDQQKITEQNLTEQKKQWDQAFGDIEGAFNSQLRGLLAGTTTWAQAMKSISGDLAIKFIEDVEKRVGEWIEGEILQTSATTAGVAARTAAETAGASTSILAQIGNALAVITADAAKTFAGVFAFLAPALGPAAAGPAAAAGAAVEAAAGGIAGMAVGGYVLQSGLVNLHQGETVVPAEVSTPYQGGQGGGVTVNMQGTMVGNQAYWNQNLQQLARLLTSYNARTPSTSWA